MTGIAGLRTGRFVAIGAAALITLIAIGACSASSTSATTSAAMAAGGAAPPMVDGKAADATFGAAEDASAPTKAGANSGPLPALDNRQIIRTADMQIRLTIGAEVVEEDVDAALSSAISAAVANVRAQAIAAGGFIADLQQGKGTASLVIRVPADAFDSFRTSAATLGDVESSTESAQDVTDEYTDVTSRIASAQKSIDRIRTLLAQATNIGDIIAIESELAAREAELESLQGRQTVLSNLVSLSTVSVSFYASQAQVTADEPVAERGGFLGGLADGWDALKSFLSGLSAVVGAVLPFVPVFAILGVLIWLVVRRIRGRRIPSRRAPWEPSTPMVGVAAGPESPTDSPNAN